MSGRLGICAAGFAALSLIGAAHAQPSKAWRHGVLEAKSDSGIVFMGARAEMSGLAFALSHREEALALTRATAHIAADDPKPAFIYDDAVKSGSVDPEMRIPRDKLEWLQNELIAMGNISAPYDLGRIIEPGIREQALARRQ